MTQSRTALWLVVLLLLICATAVNVRSKDQVNTGGLLGKWPQITEQTLEKHFSADGSQEFVATVCSSSGDPLYFLDARIPADSDSIGDYNFSGMFDCRLYPVKYGGSEIRYPTLLANVRNMTADWQTDGRFLNSELIGLAGASDTRRLVQKSRLRGMLVTIEIFNVILDKSGDSVGSFDVCFKFVNDSLATSDIAAPPMEPPPGR